MMTDRTAAWASSSWLLTSFVFLAAPVFLPSSPDPSSVLADPITLSTAVMTAISFPASLLGFVFAPLLGAIFGINQGSIAAQYLNLRLMFLFGLAQWFWLVPKLMKNLRGRKAMLAADSAGEIPAATSSWMPRGSWDRSPIEKVFEEDDRG